MRDTRFDSRSSEWMGDLTVWLRQNASDNGEQLDRLRTKLRYARSAELTQRQQLLLRLYFEEGKTMPQIARELLHSVPDTAPGPGAAVPVSAVQLLDGRKVPLVVLA